MQCVKNHKIKFDCGGLKDFPTAPEASNGSEKYTEALFLKDYKFLENISSYADQLEREQRVKTRVESSCEDDNKSPVEAEGKRRRVLEFKKIQKVGKLAELRLLPNEFSRSKRNRTHLVGAVPKKEIENECEGEPEKKSSRRGRICWTLDFVEYENCRLIETVFDISDETLIRDLLPNSKNINMIYLKNETRVKEVAKWKEIGDSDWDKTLAQVLIGAHVFEYPIFAFEGPRQREQK